MHTVNHTPDAMRAEVARYGALKARLLSEIPELDSETLADTLEGITDLHDVLAELVRSALDDETMAAGLAARLSDMKTRHERIEARAKRKRDMVLRVMSEAGIPKLAQPDFTASLRPSPPALDVVSEDKIPAAYWKPQPPRLDRQGLLAALKGGSLVDGVSIASPSPQLSIRTK